MFSRPTLDDGNPSVSLHLPDGDDPTRTDFQVVVTRRHGRSNLVRGQSTDNAPRSSRGPVPPDWFEMIVANSNLSGSRSQGGVKSELTLSGGSSIGRDIMEQAVRPIKVGKFIFSRWKVNRGGEES